MIHGSRPVGTSVFQFIVLPNTGLQICRGFKLTALHEEQIEEVWRAAERTAADQANHEVVRLVREHVACNQALEATPWIAIHQNEFVYFRLTRTGQEVHMDLLVDTQNGAGAMVHNKIPVLVQSGPSVFGRRLGRRHHLADIYVDAHKNARNDVGSLIVDFGNSGSAFVFSKEGAGPLESKPIEANNPFDPLYQSRAAESRNILRSNMIVLRVEQNEDRAPWIVLDDRAEELIQQHPLATYLYAPKKYVRNWPEHLKPEEPSMKFRGVLGQRDALHPMLTFVRYTVEQMFQHVLASITNPHGTSDSPEFYPQIARVMLTYPLTWRKADQELFRTMVEDVARRLLVHEEERVREQFRVELICSEPVAVAAYVLWETFFHFDTPSLRLAASSLGNVKGTPDLRLLVVDIGGGSTDIACVDIAWQVREEDESIDVTFKMIESMRFNRAGDRLSHLVAAALVEFLEQKYGVDESLAFALESRNPAFTMHYKRQAVSRITELAEEAKAALSRSTEPWVLGSDDERALITCFAPLFSGDLPEEKVQSAPRFELTRDVLTDWITADRQSLETNGEPGFMDIFLYLEELRASLRASRRDPSLVVLSGRSTRLPFIKDLTARALGFPLHRVRTLAEILPDSLKLNGFRNMDKLAVVCGAQRFRFGDHIRFVSLPDAQIFNRYIGTVRETPTGLKLNKVLIHPGEGSPRTIQVTVEPAKVVRIGHAFREDGQAQVMATVANNSQTERQVVDLEIIDDYSVKTAKGKEILLSEWVPGGDEIVDNFNDTGRIDGEPEGFIRRIVRRNRAEWMAGGR